MIVVKRNGFTKGVDRERRLVEAVVSTGRPDRDGDVVEPSGWVLEKFLRNRSLLWLFEKGFRVRPRASRAPPSAP